MVWPRECPVCSKLYSVLVRRYTAHGIAEFCMTCHRDVFGDAAHEELMEVERLSAKPGFEIVLDS